MKHFFPAVVKKTVLLGLKLQLLFFVYAPPLVPTLVLAACLSLGILSNTPKSFAQCDLMVDFMAPDTICFGQTFDLMDATSYIDPNCENTGTGPAGWTYEWTITNPRIPARTITERNPTNISLPNPITGSFNIVLKVTNEEGNTFDSAPFTLTVNYVFATFSPEGACINIPTTFRNASDAITQWDWTIEDLSTNTTIFTSIEEQPTYTFTQLGDYRVTLVVNCGFMDTDTITVYAEPTININTATTEVCSGQRITLYAANEQGLDMDYEWRTALHGGALLVKGDSLVQLPIDTTVYYLFGIDESGCLDTASIQVNVNPSRVINFEAFDRNACQGDTIELSVTGEGFTYVWEGDGLLDTVGMMVRAVPSKDAFYTVRTTAICPDENSVFIDVITVPPPLINNPYPVCAGDSLTITVTDGNNVFWYNENNEIIHTGLDFNPLTDTTFSFPPLSLDQEVMVFVSQSRSGCESFRLPVPIQVLSNPAPPDVSFMSPPSICINEVNGFNLNNLVTGDKGGIWQTTAPAILENGFLFQPTGSGTGVFDLTYTIHIGSCIADSLTQSIEIVESIAAFSATSTTVCVGNTVQLIDQSTNADTHQWTFYHTTNKDSIQSQEANPEITFDQEGVYDVRLTVNCGTTEMKPAYITVTNPLMTTLTASADTICTNETLSLTATGGQVYQWIPSSSIINTNNNIATIQPTTTTTYHISIVDTVSECTVMDSITILVDEGPIVTTEAANVCVGEMINIVDWVQIGEVTTVNWSGGAGIFSDATALYPIYTPATNETGMISLTVTATNDCSTTTEVLNINISDGSTDDIEAGMDLEGCQGQPITLNANAPNAINIQWSGGTGVFSDPNALETNYQPANEESGKIQLTVTAEVGCNNAVVTDSMFLHIIPSGSGQLVPAEATLSVLLGESAQLSVQGSGAYQWSPATFLSCDDCPNPSADNVTESIIYTITDLTGCSQPTTITVNIRPLPDETIMLPTAFSPNGDQQNDRLILVAQNVESFSLRIFNRWGKLVFETDRTDDSWDGYVQHEPATMGIYLYEMVYKLIGEEKMEQVKTGHITLLR